MAPESTTSAVERPLAKLRKAQKQERSWHAKDDETEKKRREIRERERERERRDTHVDTI